MSSKNNKWIRSFKVVHVLLLTSSMMLLPQDVVAANNMKCVGLYGMQSSSLSSPFWTQEKPLVDAELSVGASARRSLGFGSVEVDSSKPNPLSRNDFVIGKSEKPVKIIKYEMIAKEENSSEKEMGYAGLTAAGAKVFEEMKQTFVQRNRLSRNVIANSETLMHTIQLTRLIGANMLLTGPGGGGKSMSVDFFLSGEANKPYDILFHQMLPESAIVGGQIMEAAKNGQYKVNIAGSMADHVVAIADEAHMAGPHLIATLFPLLERGRKIRQGQVRGKAKLQTVYATMNANLSEMVDSFYGNGLGPQALPYANRWQFKAFVYNWLDIEQRTSLWDREEKKRRLAMIAKHHPEVLKDEVFVDLKPINWDHARELATAMFKLTDGAKQVLREMSEMMREENHKAVKDSEREANEQRLTKSSVLVPSGDLTTRLDLQLQEMVEYSAFIDFMNSGLPVPNKRIELDVASTWRALYMLTTVTGGQAQLKYDPQAETKWTIDYGWSFDVNKAADLREELIIKNIQAEQARFRKIFEDHLKNYHQATEMRAKALATGNSVSEPKDIEETSFELMLMRSRQVIP